MLVLERNKKRLILLAFLFIPAVFVIALVYLAFQRLTSVGYSPEMMEQLRQAFTPSPAATAAPTDVTLDDNCFETAMTTVELNQCAGHHLDKSTQLLGELLGELESELETAEWNELQLNQDLWGDFVEKDCRWVYDSFYSGTIAPMMYATCKTSYNWTRIEQLKAFLCKGHSQKVCEAATRYHNSTAFRGSNIANRIVALVSDCPSSVSGEQITACFSENAAKSSQLLETLIQELEVKIEEQEESMQRVLSSTKSSANPEYWERMNEIWSHRWESFQVVQAAWEQYRDHYCRWEKSLSPSGDAAAKEFIACFATHNYERILRLEFFCKDCEVFDLIPEDG